MSEVRLGSRGKAQLPYGAEVPRRWRLFNMSLQNRMGPQETNASFPPTRPTCPPDERGLAEVRQEKSASGGLKRDNDDESHFSSLLLHLCSAASVLRPSASVPGHALWHMGRSGS